MRNLVSMISGCITILLLATACTDATFEDSGMEVPERGPSQFNGTIYEFLESGDSRLGVRFDSLLYLLEYIPDGGDTEGDKAVRFRQLKDSLNNVSGNYTLMAVPDVCFANAFKSLNLYRKLQGLDVTSGKVSLKSLMTYRKEVDRYDDQEDPPTYVGTDVFEYKYQLDSMVCRYVLKGVYNTDSVASASSNGVIARAIFDEYRMFLSFKRLPASGFVGGGIGDMTFYDMRNTLQMADWIWTKTMWNDIYTTNGVVHVLSPAHEFGFGLFIQKFKDFGHEE